MSSEYSFDVIVVGAGPAGGQCSRDLASNGYQVLLIEKAQDFSVNNYSSAGAPIELLEDFDLPQSIVATYWNKLSLNSTHVKQVWEDQFPRGVVMEFKRLREFLAKEAEKHGAVIKLGASYHSLEKCDGGYILKLKDKEDKTFKQYKTKVIVDATGSERKVLIKNSYDKEKSLEATGMEYLVEVPSQTYQKYRETLTLLLGLHHMPQGYGWIFPMEPNKLKVGIGRYFVGQHFVPHLPSYHSYLEGLLKKYLGDDGVIIQDRHGKTLYYTYGRKDPAFQEGVIAIGDAISMLNPLALEGIRHAMTSGKIAAKYITSYLQGEKRAFVNYTKEIQKYCGIKWRLSEYIAKKIYREPDDNQIDLIVKSFKSLSFDQALGIGFGYKLWPILKFNLSYLLRKYVLS